MYLIFYILISILLVISHFNSTVVAVTWFEASFFLITIISSVSSSSGWILELESELLANEFTCCFVVQLSVREYNSSFNHEL